MALNTGLYNRLRVALCDDDLATDMISTINTAVAGGITGPLVVGAVSLTETELGYLDAVTIGTGAASKALVLDANGDMTMPDLGSIGFGGVGKISWDTTDANANKLLAQLPAGGATDVPVIVVGQSIEGVDLALYNGVVDPRVCFVGVGAVTTGPGVDFRKARGTAASPTVTTSGDDLGTIRAYGCVAAGEYVQSAEIRFDIAGTIATTRGPGTITFLTATDAAPSVLTAALTLGANQSATFGADAIVADDGLLSVGTGQTARVSWDTTDANANEMLIQLPAGGATDVPVIVIGQSIESVDLGLYNGVTEPRVAMFGVGAVATGPVMEFRKARGTIASPTVVTTADDLGSLDFYGAVAAGEYVQAAQILVEMTGTIATTRGPGVMTFKTATDAAPSVLTTAMTIRADQNVNFAVGAQTDLVAEVTPARGVKIDSGVIRDGQFHGVQPTPTAETGVATITIADILTGIVTLTHTTGATVALTLDTGTAMDAGMPASFGTDQYIDWSLINLSAAAADTGTVTAAADHTIVGNAIVQSVHATTGLIYGSSGLFRSRRTAATTWVTYRIA